VRAYRIRALAHEHRGNIDLATKADASKQQENAMKRMTMATALLLAVISTGTRAQAPAADDPHHPPQTATPVPAQPTTPPGQPGMGGMPMMMNMMGGMHHMMMMRMMGMMRPGMATIDRVEGRIAFLRAELKVTDAQASAWDAFAAALRTNAQKLAEVRAMMPQQVAGQAPTMAARLDLQERWLLARLEGTRAIKSAFTNLYGTLSDDQKKTADELLAPHLGLRMMPMMSGQMQPGQMQPGQMQPGQMPPAAQ
jgi:LTXXQ motif family protein